MSKFDDMKAKTIQFLCSRPIQQNDYDNSAQMKQQQQKSFYFKEELDDQEEQAYKEVDEKRRNLLPPELHYKIELDRSNREQSFFRVSEVFEQSQSVFFRLGWKVVELRREQQSLALLCFALFHSQVDVPVSFFTINHEPLANEQEEHNAKHLWMEGTMIMSGASRGEKQILLEMSYYIFLKDQILPLFQWFMNKYVVWEQIMSEQNGEQFIVQEFKREVIQKCAEMFSAFRRQAQRQG